MKLGRRQFLFTTASGAAWPMAARAKDAYPSRPIRVISGGSAGGTSDIFVRIVETRLRERLGQPLFIENKPGAGGMSAAGQAASAAPDGYTLFVSNLATNAIGLALYAKPSFDPKKELPPVARLATMPNAVAVRANAGPADMRALLEQLKAKPAQAFYGSAGVGTSSHLTGHLLCQHLGVAGVHVPYKGTAANLNALLAGEVLFAADNLPIYVPHVKRGTLKLLAVTQARRVADFPEVPTLQEVLDTRDFDVFSWYGFSTATGTPAAIVDQLAEQVVAVLAEPAVQKALRDIGAEPAPMGAAAYRAFIDAEIRKWQPIVKSSGAVA